MAPGTDYAADFRERAKELRSIAAVVRGSKNREVLLRCAGSYEKLAEQYQRAKIQGGTFRFPPPLKTGVEN
jgi:hypothetical protein